MTVSTVKHDILQALSKHQPAEARRAMGEHIDNSRDKMINLFSR
jgi:DNA-binding FadR family transcriptional regulator